MESVSRKFDESIFEQRFEDLFSAWRAEWAERINEPQRITERTRRILTPEELGANRPEEEAYHKLLDYCVGVIVSATKIGKHREAVTAVENVLTKRIPMPYANVIKNVLSDIFRMTLDKISASEK